jgi:hypothetical protein
MNLKNIIYDPANPDEILDLINYNFDQLLANGYGPQGTAGSIGATGSVGVQGPQGDDGGVGVTGAQGNAGSAAGLEWDSDTTTVPNTNIMVPNPSAGITALTSVTIGDDNIASNNEESQLVVGRSTVDFDSNIRLTIPGSVDYVDFIKDVSELKIAFNSNASNTLIKLNADKISFNDSADADEFMFIQPANITFKKDVIIDANANFNNDFSLAIGETATAGHILVAENDDGKLKWASPSTVGANVPVGTVVPLLYSEWNSTNFHTTDTTTSASNFTCRMGAGKTGTDYHGWYLCHGYTWFLDDGTNSKAYDAPDVSGKSFTAGSTVLQASTNPTILSGAQLDIDVTSTTASTEIDATTAGRNLGTDAYSGNNHEAFNLVKNIHIIYLGVNFPGTSTAMDLTWRFTDVTDAAEYNTLSLRKWNYSLNQSPTCGSNNWNNSNYYDNVTAYVKKDSQCQGGCDGILGNYGSGTPLYSAPGVHLESGIYWLDEQAGNGLDVQFTYNYGALSPIGSLTSC